MLEQSTGATVDSVMLDLAQIDTTGAGNILELAEPYFRWQKTAAEPNEFFVALSGKISATTQDTKFLSRTLADRFIYPGLFTKTQQMGPMWRKMLIWLLG